MSKSTLLVCSGPRRNNFFRHIYCFARRTAPSFFAGILILISAQVIGTSLDGIWWFDIADIDNDNDLDIIASRDGDNVYSWHENTDGSGGTWSAHVIDTLTYSDPKPRDIVAADMDGDSDYDAVTCDEHEKDVFWYENSGTSLTSATKHTIDATFGSNKPRAVVAGDIDGDNDNDLMVGGEDDVRYYENTGSGFNNVLTVTSGTIGKTYALALGDIDGDDDLDCAVADQDAKACGWLENIGGGTSWIYTQVTTFDMNKAYGVDVGDFDGDAQCRNQV